MREMNLRNNLLLRKGTAKLELNTARNMEWFHIHSGELRRGNR